MRFHGFSDLPYGIVAEGRGATPQIADAHGGSGDGVGMRVPLPWVAAVPPLMQVPVKVLMLGKVLTPGLAGLKPSVAANMMMTSWFSSVSVKPSLPTVMSRLFGTSGIGQQVTFSTVPDGQCPEVTGKANTSRVL